VLELRRVPRSVVECHAEPADLDRLSGATLRVAPDQVLLLGEPGRGDDVAAARRALGPGATVVDATDGWTAFALEGEGIELALSYLSRLEVPDEGFVQGDVANVPVKAIASPGRVELLVPSMWEAHLRDRILRRCAPVGVREAGA